eukprot:8991166-Lingulodinium_polyedra.AAC.1
MVYRLWAKIRAQQVADWEATQFLDSFWASKGRGSLDAIADQEVYDEAALGTQCHVATIIGDLAKADEEVDHARL